MRLTSSAEVAGPRLCILIYLSCITRLLRIVHPSRISTTQYVVEPSLLCLRLTISFRQLNISQSYKVQVIQISYPGSRCRTNSGPLGNRSYSSHFCCIRSIADRIICPNLFLGGWGAGVVLAVTGISPGRTAMRMPHCSVSPEP